MSRSPGKTLVKLLVDIVGGMFNSIHAGLVKFAEASRSEEIPEKSLDQRFKEEQAEVADAMAERRFAGLYWMSTTMTRHNSECRHFNNCTGFATRQRVGNPCELCGG